MSEEEFIPPAFDDISEEDLAALDDQIDMEESAKEDDIDQLIGLDSELRKPAKEMNPAKAIYEACKLPPHPLCAHMVSSDGKIYTSIDAEGKLRFDHGGVDQKKVEVRCPICVKTGGYLILKNNTLPCRCCQGFIYISESMIISYIAGLNEVSEEKRILAETKQIIADRKSRKISEKEQKRKDAEKKRIESANIGIFGEGLVAGTKKQVSATQNGGKRNTSRRTKEGGKDVEK